MTILVIEAALEMLGRIARMRAGWTSDSHSTTTDLMFDERNVARAATAAAGSARRPGNFGCVFA
jgi:hypothetical protein